MKEVKHRRFAGPLKRIPFKNYYIQSPVGLVPKAGGKTRLIFHLSYDFSETNTSLNKNTPDDMCSVKYKDLDYAIATCLNLIRKFCLVKGRNLIFFAKTDLESAFRILPVLISHCCWLVLKAEDPKTGVFMFFVDKCLPFGASISCAQFQKFSEALETPGGVHS